MVWYGGIKRVHNVTPSLWWKSVGPIYGMVYGIKRVHGVTP
jgi:hypothetical protein